MMTATLPDMPIQQLAAPPAVLDTDGDLIAAWIEHGNREAMAELFSRHAEDCLRLAVRRLGTLSEAEDAVQDAFIRVMRLARTFRRDAAGGSARGWIFAIVANTCVSRLREQQARIRREQALRPVRDHQDPDPDLGAAVR